MTAHSINDSIKLVALAFTAVFGSFGLLGGAAILSADSPVPTAAELAQARTLIAEQLDDPTGSAAFETAFTARRNRDSLVICQHVSYHPGHGRLTVNEYWAAVPYDKGYEPYATMLTANENLCPAAKDKYVFANGAVIVASQ
jgi:hypothetical protein